MSGAVEGIRISCVTDIAYNSGRELHLSGVGKLLVGIQVLLGTAAAGFFVTQFAALAPLVALVSATAGVILLVLDPNGRAREHRVIRAKYHELLATIDECEPTPELLCRWNATLQRIAASEPPAYRAAAALAYNSAIRALKEDDFVVTNQLTIPRRDRFWAQVCPFSNRIYMRGGQSPAVV